MPTRTPNTSDPVLYCHLSPGWYISGRVAKRFIHSSGPSGVRGSGGPMTSCRSCAALTIGNGGSKVGSMISPWPIRKVRRSSTVMGRRAGTVSSSGPSMRLSTSRFASSGSSRSTGSSRASAPSSTSNIVARARIGFVIDVMRKIVSRRIGSLEPKARVPIVSTWTSSPRATSVTMPGSSPFATRAAIASCKRPRPGCDLESITDIPPMPALSSDQTNCLTRAAGPSSTTRLGRDPRPGCGQVVEP